MQLYIALSYMQGTVLTAIGYIPSVFLLKNIMDSLSYNYLFFFAYFCVTLLNLCFTIPSVIQYTLITAFCDPF